MSAKRTFLLDIGAVKQYGVDRWRTEFSWPVPDHEFLALASAIEDHLRSTIAIAPRDIGTVLTVARALPVVAVEVLHAHAVVARLRAAGHTPRSSRAESWYAEALDASLVAVDVVGTRRRFMPAVRIVRWGRDMMANAALPKFVARIRDGRHTWVVGAPHTLLAEYLTQTPAWVATLYDDTIPPPPALPPALCSALHECAVAFADACSAIAQRCGLPIDDIACASLRVHADAICAGAATALVRARAYVSAHPLAHLALSSVTHHGQRALALAVREHGGHVTSAAHGGFVGLFNSAMPTWSEFVLSDTYVTYTGGSAELCRRIYTSRPLLIPNTLAIVSGKSRMYRALRDAIQGMPPAHIRRVMVIGFPQTPYRKYTAAASLGLQQLDVELRMVDLLRAAGYDVVYKAHPDRLAEIRGIFDERVEMITEDFYTAHRYADAFIFGSMRTTAFPIALATTKPIVALHVEPEPSSPFPDAFALLARRIAIIPAVMDANARIQFDSTALRDALAMAIARASDTAFFDTYLAVPHT